MTWPFSAVASHLPWSTLCQCRWGVARSEQLEHGWLLAAGCLQLLGVEELPSPRLVYHEAFYPVIDVFLEDSWFPCTDGVKEDPWQVPGEGRLYLALARSSAWVGDRPQCTCLQVPNGISHPMLLLYVEAELWICPQAVPWRGACACLPQRAPRYPEEGTNVLPSQRAHGLLVMCQCQGEAEALL